MSVHRFADHLWHDAGVAAAMARTVALPAELIYRSAVAARNGLFDAGFIASHGTGVPTISVGNLTVGGTGKTPMAAFIASLLRERGARPAILMRGYGQDEIAVHRRLNPGIAVVASPDRLKAAGTAVQDHGANVLILDDGFQHRRVRRDLDVVAISADAPFSRRHVLPAGPWREPISALKRASIVLVSRKAAGDDTVAAVRHLLFESHPGLPVVEVTLRHGHLHGLDGEAATLSHLRTKRVLMIAAVAQPYAFMAQLQSAGALVSPAVFRDHHNFTPLEVAELVRQAAACDMAVCTLKDAVKLEGLWPRATVPLWYVSQTVELGYGGETLLRMIDSTMALKP